MNEAIKLAIDKGGYEPFSKVSIKDGKIEFRNKTLVLVFLVGLSTRKEFNDIALDPHFWQALGKALGWEEIIGTGYFTENRYQRMEESEVTWVYYALRYFKLKLTGGDEETFWKELIKP